MKKTVSIILALLVAAGISTATFATADSSANVNTLPRKGDTTDVATTTSKRQTNSTTIITENSQKVKTAVKKVYSNSIEAVDIAPQTDEYKLSVDLSTPVVYEYNTETKQLEKVDSSLYKAGSNFKITFDKSVDGILVISRGELVKK